MYRVHLFSDKEVERDGLGEGEGEREYGHWQCEQTSYRPIE